MAIQSASGTSTSSQCDVHAAANRHTAPDVRVNCVSSSGGRQTLIARVAVWEPMPTDDRDWVVEAATSVPGVRATYHLLDPETGNGLSIAVFDDEDSAQAAGSAIRRRADEIGWNDQPRPASSQRRFTG